MRYCFFFIRIEPRNLSNLVTKRNNDKTSAEKNIRLLRALKQAIEYLNNSPLKAQKILKDQLGLDKNLIISMWSDYYYRLFLGHSLMLTIKDEARWAAETGLVDSPIKIDFERYIDPMALSIVDEDAVQL